MIRLGKYDYEKVTALLQKWEVRHREAFDYASVGKYATLQIIARTERDAIRKCIDELKQAVFDATT